MLKDQIEDLYELSRTGMKLGIECKAGIELGLETTKKLVNALGNPDKKYRIVQIAGTNGKGSTSAFIAQILQEAGHIVGLYTSPHLVKFNERIKVNNHDIADYELSKLISVVQKVAKENNLQPTFFEFTTAVALYYFANKKVDFAVLEVGLGGRLDSTTATTPEVTAITNISLDHTHILGETISEIAAEKAGIVKSGVPLFTTEKNNPALDIFRLACEKIGSELILVRINTGLELSLQGKHQFENASLAAKVCERLGIKEMVIRKGLINTKWAGRLEMVDDNVLIDCAHNPAGMESLVSYLKKIKRKILLVFALSEKKNVGEIVKIIAPLVEKVVVTTGNYHSQNTSIIASEFKKYLYWVKEEPSVGKAIMLAKKEAEKRMIIITGSMYMIGDALKFIRA